MTEHIVVTIPRSRMAMVEAEEARVAKAMERGQFFQFYWDMGRCPKGWEDGTGEIRRIYFLWDEAVRAWHTFQGARRHAGRWRLYMHPKIHEIDPIPMKPFRGYRWFKESRA